jgi:hypothetical protein
MCCGTSTLSEPKLIWPRPLQVVREERVLKSEEPTADMYFFIAMFCYLAG